MAKLLEKWTGKKGPWCFSSKITIISVRRSPLNNVKIKLKISLAVR